MQDTVTVKFSIGGKLRFLSHQETVSLFERALVRSGMRVVYSEGFNPRPRMSLPLPRSVGLAVEDDMLCFAVGSEVSESFDGEGFRERLTRELPQGVEVAAVALVPGRKSFHAGCADYVLQVKEEYIGEVREQAAYLAGQGKCLVERHLPKKGTTRMVNARDFVESVVLEGNEITVRCRITEAGAIRVDELMTLLGTRQPMLSGPVMRRNVHWQRRN